MNAALLDWLNSGRHLPEILRDFHDQKAVFKALHSTYKPAQTANPISWVDGQIYTIDLFLWAMAQHGYTLQRCRAAKPFEDIGERIARFERAETEAFRAMLKATTPERGPAHD